MADIANTLTVLGLLQPLQIFIVGILTVTVVLYIIKKI